MLTWIIIGLAALIVLVGVLKWVFRIGKFLVTVGLILFLASFALNTTERGRYVTESFKEGLRSGYEWVETKVRRSG